MAKFTKEIQAQKRTQAKTLYTKGIDLETISEIIGVAISTVKKWYDADNFEQAKSSQFIALSELRNTILESFVALKNGEKPTIKPDEAAKYAAAFEKLSDKKKVLSFMFEAYELLTDEFTKDVQNAKATKAKEEALLILKVVRSKTDAILTKLTSETLNDN